MNDEAIQTAPPASLAGMIEPGPQPARMWNESDLAAILRHQLAASIDADLTEFLPHQAHRLSGQGLLGQGMSFAQVLSMSAPPVEMLDAVKEFAKAIYHHQAASLPREIGKVLYFATLAAAERRLGTRMTQLDDGSLRQGYAWAAAQPWITPQLRELFESSDSSPPPVARQQ